MEKINLYIMDLSFDDNTSGVNRYLSTLTEQLKGYVFIHVFQLKFVVNRSILFYQENERDNYTEVIVPLPQQMKEIINERYWFQKYNEYVFSLTKHLFANKSNCIIHIHTLNLIALASYIKTQVPCKIITHLHCIPWKASYNDNKKKFNRLYYQSSVANNILDEKQYITNNCERESYTAPNKIICVTDCGKEFLKKAMKISGENITVISNGINDLGADSDFQKPKTLSDTFQCLFVGVLTESKGIFYILQALRLVQQKGYKIMLNIAEKGDINIRQRIIEEYSDLQVNLLGRIPFEELQKHYQESDIGLIASLQEQCSYAAIEMAMFGLPIITTAVDGLDEMFTDGVNALKVNTKFSKVFGLSVYTDMLADKIITLIENDDLIDIWMTYHSDSDVPIPYLNDTFIERLAIPAPDTHPKDICMFVSSPVNNSHRIEYLRELMQYIPIDSFGKLFHNTDAANDTGYKTKQRILSEYKFTLSFENALYDDYVTEKFYDPLLAGSVPVYLGALNIDIFSPGNNAFVDVRKYPNPADLAAVLHQYCTNQKPLDDFFQWKNQPFHPEFIEIAQSQSISPFERLIRKIRDFKPINVNREPVVIKIGQGLLRL